MRGEPSRGAGRSNPPLLLREPGGYTGARWSDVTRMLLEYGAAAHSRGASRACARWRGSRTPAPRRSRRRRANPVAWASRPRSAAICTSAPPRRAAKRSSMSPTIRAVVPASRHDAPRASRLCPRRLRRPPVSHASTLKPRRAATIFAARCSATSCPRRKKRSPTRASPTTAARPNRWRGKGRRREIPSNRTLRQQSAARAQRRRAQEGTRHAR